MALVAAPTSVSFASIASGTTETQTVTITPDYPEDSIYSVTVEGADAVQFAVTQPWTNSTVPNSSSVVIPHSEYEDADGVLLRATSFSDTNRSFTVTYQPSASGTHNATVVVRYNGVGSTALLQVAVTGTAT